MPQENLEPKHNQTKYKPDNISFKKVKAEKIKSSEVIKVIIPAYNEEESIAKVIAEIPEIVQEIIVALWRDYRLGAAGGGPPE